MGTNTILRSLDDLVSNSEYISTLKGSLYMIDLVATLHANQNTFLLTTSYIRTYLALTYVYISFYI